MTEPMVMVCCASHRSREKLLRLAPGARAFYNLDRHATGGFYEIPARLLGEARQITGVTRVRSEAGFAPCWPTFHTRSTT